ncbi:MULTISPECIES: MarR family winged helix-turn-helix transcriptional regulator [unclassified Paenibacillus]|uniref:MarR family winged helix-turn-helix transcriptional regulator n=1 Tax=unclassified Paenibacillus TaxID=185978 RepID=UPI0009AEC94C|nr:MULTISPECIES: MarR family transcriptional regulator [unclassified Paenibacillus]MBE1443653.1 DNA-binding MarR family transcriptional regulator [Paenibacillus sp. OAS669]
MNKDDWLKLENQLCFAVYACSKEITRLYRPLLDELGLTYTQYVTLLALWEEDGVTVKELGSRLYLDSGTLTPLLKRLEQMELIKRVRDSKDERQVIIRLTEQGTRLKEQAYDIPGRLFCRMGIEQEEAAEWRERLTALLHTIHHMQTEE